MLHKWRHSIVSCNATWIFHLHINQLFFFLFKKEKTKEKKKNLHKFLVLSNIVRALLCLLLSLSCYDRNSFITLFFLPNLIFKNFAFLVQKNMRNFIIFMGPHIIVSHDIRCPFLTTKLRGNECDFKCPTTSFLDRFFRFTFDKMQMGTKPIWVKYLYFHQNLGLFFLLHYNNNVLQKFIDLLIIFQTEHLNYWTKISTEKMRIN